MTVTHYDSRGDREYCLLNGWRIDQGKKTLVLGHGVPRIEVPLDGIAEMRLDEFLECVNAPLEEDTVESQRWGTYPTGIRRPLDYPEQPKRETQSDQFHLVYKPDGEAFSNWVASLSDFNAFPTDENRKKVQKTWLDWAREVPPPAKPTLSEIIPTHCEDPEAYARGYNEGYADAHMHQLTDDDEFEDAIERGRCTLAPEGWWCSLPDGHDGPCPARRERAHAHGEKAVGE